jgi:hypothetical protein
MRRSLLVLLLSGLLTSCGDEPANYDPEAHDGAATAKVEDPKEGTHVEGIGYNADSMALKALVLYSRANIYTYCSGEIERITEKDAKVYDGEGLHTLYRFQLTRDKLDSLAYYGIKPEDISKDDRSKPIFLTGKNELKAKGIYEAAIVTLGNIETNYPKLYSYGCENFLRSNKPKIISSTITDQSTKYADYDVEFILASGQAIYLSYSVKAAHGQVYIDLNKDDDQ